MFSECVCFPLSPVIPLVFALIYLPLEFSSVAPLAAVAQRYSCFTLCDNCSQMNLLDTSSVVAALRSLSSPFSGL